MPYQLHCDAQADELEVATELDVELGTELDVFTELLVEVATLVEVAVLVDHEVFTELLVDVAALVEVATLVEVTTEDDDDVRDDDVLEGVTLDDQETALPQIAPVTAGVSTAPLVFTCIPKATVWPGWIAPFQLRLVAL